MVLSEHHRTNHAKTVVQMKYTLATLGREDIKGNAYKLAEALIDLGLDKETDGFWILPINKLKPTLENSFEYFSPVCISRSLGAKVKGFPMKASSWMKRIHQKYVPDAVDAFYKHLEDPKNEYFLPVEYRRDTGDDVKLICQGTVVNREEPENMYMIGTHEIIE